MSLQAGQKRQRPEQATHEPSAKRHRPNSPPPSHANIDLDQYPISSPLIKPWAQLAREGVQAIAGIFSRPIPAAPTHVSGASTSTPRPLPLSSVSHQDPRLVPSSFSPSKTPFSGWNTRQLNSNYQSARESWRWEVMEKRGAGESRIPKPPSLVAMEIEMKRRKDAGVWQERTFDPEWPARSRRTGAQGNSAPANAFRRRKPMGSDKHKASLVDRDLGVLHALQNGAEVVSPGASSSGLNGGASRSSEAREADDYDYFESLRGACVSQEEAQRLEDKEIYRRAIEERMRVQDGDQSASDIHITRHPASAGARQRQQPRTTFSLINPNAYFPEASPFVSTLRHTKPAKPSKIPVPSSSRSIDLILGKAKKTELEPKYSGDAFERYEALTQAVAEVEDLEEEEAARQKRRIYPEALSSEHRAIVKAALYGSDYYKTIPGAEVRTADIRRLRPGTWLNDESINYVGILINQRSNEADASGERGEGEKKLRKVFCMRTNFYETFTKQGFAKVKRWTKKFDTFEKDIIIIPINQGGAHWVCAAVNIAKKRIEFYDSMGQPRPKVYQNLRSWLEQEHMNRKKAPIDLSDWENYWDEDRPEQGNGYDCGIFTCSFMESLSREVTGFDFTQDNMDYLRQKVVLTIDQGKLLELEEWE